MGNVITVIFPYRHHGTWVFDDEIAGNLQILNPKQKQF